MKTYKQGQIDLFNRLWDASVGKTDNDLEAMVLLIKELRKVRDEIVNPSGYWHGQLDKNQANKIPVDTDRPI